jgi:hemolysin activation/secretion protein
MQGSMRGQVTISDSDARVSRARPYSRSTLVIISLALATAGARAGDSSLTTSVVSGPLLGAVVVDGSSAYAAPQLFTAYRDQLGHPIARESARAVAEAVVAMYELDGYVKPEVALDDSMTGRGVLRVQVHEAQVTRVTFEGDTQRYRDDMQRIAQRLEQSKPLRREDVPQALRELRQLSGVTVTASTRRDTQVRNGFELVVRAEFAPMNGVVRMNNRGTDQAGPVFVLGQFFVNGIGIGSQGKLGLIVAAATEQEEYLGGGLYFDTASASGTRFSTLLFKSQSAPNERPTNFDDEYLRERLTLRVQQPLHQEGTTSLSLGFAFDADDLAIARSGESLREERLRVVEAALRAGWRGGASQYSSSLVLRRGLDGAGAGLQAPDLVNDPRRVDFLVVGLTGNFYRRFATDWSLRFDALGQYTGYVLPDGERFKIGGDRLGRGFEVAEIAGDRGLGGKIELRRDLFNTEGLLGRVSAYGFYDVGAAWKNDRPGRQSATTAGTGFAMQGATLTGYLEVAAPLTGADIEGKREPSLFAELSYKF